MILRILPLVLLTVLLPDLYIYFRHFKGKNRKHWLHILLYTPGTALICFILALALNESHSPENMNSIALFLMFYMLTALPKTLYMLSSLLMRALAFFIPILKKAVTPVSLIVALAFFGLMLTGYTYGPQNIQVKQVDFYSADLPDCFDGYRIVQFTDLHLVSFQSSPQIVEKAVDMMLAQRPDLIAFTGDLVSIDAHELKAFEKTLSRLHAPDGVYSILGNHDYLEYARYLSEKERATQFSKLKSIEQRMGWQLLLNENRIIRKGNDSIAILGVENDGKPPFPERGNLAKALNKLPANAIPGSDSLRMFKVLLSHDPSHWKRKVLPQTDIQLMLAGHTHGMQFMLFGWSPSQYIYPEWNGMYKENNRALHVSMGLGGALIPFRFGAWPEINVITLRKK